MVVYCSGNTSRGHNDFFDQLCCLLKKSGHSPICHKNVAFSQNPQKTFDGAQKPTHFQATRALTSADLVFLEVSAPATVQVGWELSQALSLGKPIVACYKQGAMPDFIKEIEDDHICWCEYEPTGLDQILKKALRFANLKTRMRFNLILSQRHYNFLEKIAAQYQIAKATYLRNLLEKEMESH